MKDGFVADSSVGVAWAVLAQSSPVVDDEGPRLALGRISDLAEEHALSVYDAACSELALRRGLPLASRDAALNEAAGRCGVESQI